MSNNLRKYCKVFITLITVLVISAVNIPSFLTLKAAEKEEGYTLKTDLLKEKTEKYTGDYPKERYVFEGDAKTSYQLEPGVKNMLEKLEVPYDSAEGKKAVLSFVQDKVLVDTFCLKEDLRTKLYILAKPETKEIFAVGINLGTENQMISIHDENQKDIPTQALCSFQFSETNPEQLTQNEPKEETAAFILESNTILYGKLKTDYLLAEAASSVDSSNANKDKANRRYQSARSGGADSQAALNGAMTATKETGDNSLFKLNLQIKSQPKIADVTSKKGVNVIFSLDLSGNMIKNSEGRYSYYSDNFERSIKAIDNAAKFLMKDPNQNVRIGFVGFSSSNSYGIAHKTIQPMTSDINTFRKNYLLSNGCLPSTIIEYQSLYNKLLTQNWPSLTDGSNLQAGLVGAAEMAYAAREDDRDNVVIYLTDGNNTHSYKSTYNDDILHGNATVPYIEENVMDSNGYSNISSYKNAQLEAESLKASGASLYSVGLNTLSQPLCSEFLDSIASTNKQGVKQHYDAGSYELSRVFEDISNNIIEEQQIIDHGYLEFSSNISSYMDYYNTGKYTPVLEYSDDGGNTWKTVAAEEYEISNVSSTQLKGKITKNYHSDNLYQLSYYVQMKQNALGQKIHKDQTSGKNPTAGTDGVIASGYTYLKSNLTGETEVMVPAVYLPITDANGGEVIKDPTLEGKKTAEADGKYGNQGLNKIQVDMQAHPGENQVISNQPTDVVIILDMSASIEDSAQWTKVKKSLDAVIPTLLPENKNGNIRVGMVGFGSIDQYNPESKKAHKQLCGFTSNAADLQQVYNQTNSFGQKVSLLELRDKQFTKDKTVIGPQTNAQAGFIAAEELLKSRKGSDSKRNSIVVFFTDGAANKRYLSGSVGSSSYTESSFSEGLQASSGDKEAASIAAINQVANLKAAANVESIYSIGFNFNSADAYYAPEMLKKISGDKYKVANKTNLPTVFENIGKEIVSQMTASSTMTLTDPMSKYVDFMAKYDNIELKPKLELLGKNSGDSSTVLQEGTDYTLAKPDTSNNNTLTLEIKKLENDRTYRLSYYIKIKEEYANTRLHSTGSSGGNPTPGTSGVVANGYTYLTSDLVPKEQEIKVPTVYYNRSPYQVTLTKVSGETGDTLKGAEFTLKSYGKIEDNKLVLKQPESLKDIDKNSSSWQEVCKITSGENGEMDLGKLPEGTYMLRETKAPQMYATPRGYWMIKVKPVSNKQYGYALEILGKEEQGELPPAFIVDHKNESYKIPNHLMIFSLPMSGNKGIKSIMVGGALLVFMSVTWYIVDLKIRKRDQQRRNKIKHS